MTDNNRLTLADGGVVYSNHGVTNDNRVALSIFEDESGENNFAGVYLTSVEASTLGKRLIGLAAGL